MYSIFSIKSSHKFFISNVRLNVFKCLLVKAVHVSSAVILCYKNWVCTWRPVVCTEVFAYSLSLHFLWSCLLLMISFCTFLLQSFHLSYTYCSTSFVKILSQSCYECSWTNFTLNMHCSWVHPFAGNLCQNSINPIYDWSCSTWFSHMMILLFLFFLHSFTMT